jgi:hypothetical protein
VDVDTVCFVDFDQGSEMIIFELIMTTFTASIGFRGCWGSMEDWLKLKIKPP